MDPRAADLIRSLRLEPHPEGGHFREIFRGRQQVQPLDGRPARAAVTSIYFLLLAGERSRWHRVASDEVWHFYDGSPLELLRLDPRLEQPGRALLGPLDGGAEPVHVVPAGDWQAARTTGPYTLVGCTVGPGFDFADFEMLRDRSSEAAQLKQRHPELAPLL